MATYYAINAGGNWSAGGTWSTTSAKNSTRTGGSTQPTNTDTCILDDWSGSVTVDTTTCVCLTLDCSGHTNTLTFTSAKILTVGSGGAGNITFPSGAGGTIAGTGLLAMVSGTHTITSNSVVMTGGLTLNAGTWTFTGDLQIKGAFTYNLGNTFSGKLIFNGTSWTVGSKATLGGGTVEFKSTFTLPANCSGFNTTFNSGGDTLTFPASLSLGKTVTYTSGTIDATTNSSLASIPTGSTLATSGMTFYSVALTGTVTFTQDFNCTNLAFNTSTTTVGAYTITCDKFRMGSSSTLNFTSSVANTLAAGSSIVVNTYLYLHGNYPFVTIFSSGTPSSPAYLTYNGTRANCQVNGCAFTDIDAHNGTRIFALYSTVLRSPNIVQLQNSDIQNIGSTIQVN